MTNAFLEAIENELNVTETWNGAKAYKSTMNSIVDLFGKIGSSRSNVEKARKLFAKAYSEDPETATRILFYARDIRGGQGEREVFRNLFKYLATQNSEVASKLIELIPVYGRWDDMLILEESKVWDKVLEVIKNQFVSDLKNYRNGESISLLAKWMPSANASSKDSRRIALKIAAYLGLTEKQYRKALSAMRKHIDIVESKMCDKNWESINYEKLPSRAQFMYRKSFRNHDSERYQSFLDAVERGEAKINASTLYPYDVYTAYHSKYGCMVGSCNDQTIDLMWDNLPNYMEDRPFNGLVVADVSGSMYGVGNNPTPMAVSVSLAVYIAERNTSKTWKNKFFTFSEKPQLQTIVGKTIGSKFRNLERSEWGNSTNIQAVFNTILETAMKNNLSQDEMPEKLFIVSDMQFNHCVSGMTNFEAIKAKFENAGYRLPQLVFWQVNATSNVPIKVNDKGVCLVSGASPSILKTLLGDKPYTPLDVVRDTVYTERYEPVGSVFN